MPVALTASWVAPLMPPTMRSLPFALLCLALLLPASALPYEGAVTREEKPPAPKAPTLTKAPELVRFVPAVYPEQAAKEGVAGDVVLTIDIAVDGTVSHAEVTRPAGHGFDEAALAAVRQFLFTPAELDNVPAPVRIEYTYKFVLNEAPPAAAPTASPPSTPASLIGHTIERASRKPIVGANVHCDETGEVTVTDSKGAFELHLQPGKLHIGVSAAGYRPFSREETIEKGKQLEVTYHLMPVSFGLFQTVVRAERDKREATQRSLEREELEKIPGTMGDPIRVLQNLPGVARTPYLSGQLIVRGASPQETGTYLDSVEIPLLFHFLGGPSVVNPEFLDHLDFLPGGFGSRYGRAIGGIVDAYTRRGNSEGAHGSIKTDALDTAGFVETPLTEKLSVAGAARRSYIDAILPLFMPSDATNGSISILPVYWDYQARADYGKKTDKSQLTLMAFGSDDTISVAAKGGQANRDLRMDMHTGFHRVRLGWLFRDGRFTNLAIPYFGRDVVDLGVESQGTSTLSGATRTWAGGLRDEASYELTSNAKARLGLDIQFATTQASFTLPGSLPDYRVFPGASPLSQPESLQRSVHESTWGFYHEWEIRPFSRLTLMPGVRVDVFHFTASNKVSFDPRLVARYKVADATTVKGSIGHYSMSPGAFNADTQYGNPDIGLQKAFQSSFGVEQKLTDVIDIDVTGFYNRRYDVVVLSKGVVATSSGLKPEYYNNDGLGRAYGIEVMLRHNITRRFFGWLAYTLSRTEERKKGDTHYVPGAYDEPHIFTLVAQYNFGTGWSVGGRFRLVSGRPYTPYSSSTFDGNADRYLPVSADLRSGRNPMFNQLDLRVDKEWLFDLWKVGVYLDVQNVYNASNIEAWQWDYRYRDRAGIPGIPILPTLGLKGSF